VAAVMAPAPPKRSKMARTIGSSPMGRKGPSRSATTSSRILELPHPSPVAAGPRPRPGRRSIRVQLIALDPDIQLVGDGPSEPSGAVPQPGHVDHGERGGEDEEQHIRQRKRQDVEYAGRRGDDEQERDEGQVNEMIQRRAQPDHQSGPRVEACARSCFSFGSAIAHHSPAHCSVPLWSAQAVCEEAHAVDLGLVAGTRLELLGDAQTSLGGIAIAEHFEGLGRTQHAAE